MTPKPGLSPLRRLSPENPVPDDPPPQSHPADPPKAAARTTLSLGEAGLGVVVLLLWLALFGGGILVDTEPYRRTISPGGAAALKGEPVVTAPLPDAGQPAQPGAAQPAPAHGLLKSWLIVLTCFLPLNLAWLCVTASSLGAFGNLANLSDDDARTQRASDTTNPFLSAILRGFFVYLFLLSGLLLLDDAPFSNAGPGQYIRLAGFLSLFSFVVSYHPRFFSALVLSAFQRIQVRGGEGGQQGGRPAAGTVSASVDVDLEVETGGQPPETLARR